MGSLHLRPHDGSHGAEFLCGRSAPRFSLLRTSGIDPESPESLFFVDLDDLNLEDVTVGDFIAATAEVLHDKQEHEFMDSGWILKLSAVMIADQILARKCEIQPERGIQLAVKSIENFGKVPRGDSAKGTQRPERSQLSRTPRHHVPSAPWSP